MKPCALLLLLALECCVCSCQTENTATNASAETAMKKFPGFTKPQMQQMLAAKEQNCIPADMDAGELATTTGGKCAIPLPTWLPDGFVVERINARLGKNLKVDSMAMSIVYSKKTDGGKKQTFMIEARFEFGDMLYSEQTFVTSALGKVYLYYEPIDDTLGSDSTRWGKKILNFVMSDYIVCDSAEYPKYVYMSMGDLLEENGIVIKNNFEMIPLEETKMIIASLQKL
jgi:hypothetical protein